MLRVPRVPREQDPRRGGWAVSFADADRANRKLLARRHAVRTWGPHRHALRESTARAGAETHLTPGAWWRLAGEPVPGVAAELPSEVACCTGERLVRIVDAELRHVNYGRAFHDTPTCPTCAVMADFAQELAPEDAWRGPPGLISGSTPSPL